MTLGNMNVLHRLYPTTSKNHAKIACYNKEVARFGLILFYYQTFKALKTQYIVHILSIS